MNDIDRSPRSSRRMLVCRGLAALALALTCAAAHAQTAAQTPSQAPVQPGAMRILIHTPSDWIARQDPRTPRLKLYVCKPLACYDPANVSISTQPTLARHPDPKALDRLAKIDLPKLLLAQSAAAAVLSDGTKKTDVLSSEPGTVKGYPAVIMETQAEDNAKVSFIDRDIIFAGPVMISIVSASANRDDAKRHIGDFVAGITLIEGPPADAAPPMPQPPGAAPSGPASPGGVRSL